MRTRARRSPRGFSILEAVVVLVLIGLLAAFTYPKLQGATVHAEDNKAQTTASSALDSVTSLYSNAGVYDGVGCNTTSGPNANLNTGPYTTAQATNCPQFANPNELGPANPEIKFALGNIASSGAANASVSAVLTAQGWRVAVAVLSSSDEAKGSGVSTCMMAWRSFPSAGLGGGDSKEEYFTATTVTSPSAPNATEIGKCTGNSAVTQTTSASDWANLDGGYCAGLSPALGTSWQAPCPEYGSTVPGSP